MSTAVDTTTQLAEAEARIERYAVPRNLAEASILDDALATRHRLSPSRPSVDWHTNPAGWYVAHTIGYDLYVFPPIGSGPYTWMLDNADGRPIAAGDADTLDSALQAATAAYLARVTP